MSESWVFLEWEALNVVGALDSELRAGTGMPTVNGDS
jgi:hypothetical protein